MVTRMMKASEIVEDLAFQPVMARLAGLVLDTFGSTENEYVARTLTLDDMAARIGSTREMVCRYLYNFAEKGAIEIKRTELKITDKDYLEQKAGKMK
jgi:CRP/FNR family transcriptional regulator